MVRTQRLTAKAGGVTGRTLGVAFVRLIFESKSTLTFAKSSWSLWRSTKNLAHRNTPRSLKSSEDVQDAPQPPAKGDSDETDEDPVHVEMERDDGSVPAPAQYGFVVKKIPMLTRNREF